ncbi:hypothetical protein Mapa_016537 [Marchantia paleacea]|nr:hypothetical protein Mapa_016537 [Marchantia paleacea]
MMNCVGGLAIVLFLARQMAAIHGAPLRTTFEGCTTGTLFGLTYDCCPLEYKRPILNFELKYNASAPVRIRRALQCLDEDEASKYEGKLRKAISLMKALPADDPRSFTQQSRLHCAYGTGSFITGTEGFDIHFSWFFHPWHRWFLYFHERILQSLLDDPTFTLHFWNWDHEGQAVTGRNKCSKSGMVFPAMYADPDSPLFHPARSTRAKIPALPVDLGITVHEADHIPHLPKDFVLARNVAVMHETMVINSTSSRIFFGRDFRAGDKRLENIEDGVGSLESRAHASVHWWVGADLKTTPTAANDPVFYAHHGNVDRMWKMWLRSGPGRENPTDPDFLDAEFLFFDETKNLNRVKVRDALEIRTLGYDYDEEVNDASWYYNTSWNSLLRQKIGNYTTTERSESDPASQASHHTIQDPK